MSSSFCKLQGLKPIRSMDDMMEYVRQLGFFPMFESGIKGYSIYECTPNYWDDIDEGPWGWKGPSIREGGCAYGKFFNRKAGYVSLDWVPDFLNYRRSIHLAPNEDAAALDDIVLQTIQIEGRATIQELRSWLGLSRSRRRADELVDDAPIVGKINLDTNLTRLMMEGRVTIADFTYNTDRHGNRYGWGIAVYTTPENLFGATIKATCSPAESYDRICRHMRTILPGITPKQLTKLIGPAPKDTDE